MNQVLIKLPRPIAKRLLSYAVNTDAFKDNSGDAEVMIGSLKDALASKPLDERLES